MGPAVHLEAHVDRRQLVTRVRLDGYVVGSTVHGVERQLVAVRLDARRAARRRIRQPHATMGGVGAVDGSLEVEVGVRQAGHGAEIHLEPHLLAISDGVELVHEARVGDVDDFPVVSRRRRHARAGHRHAHALQGVVGAVARVVGLQ